MSDNKYLEKIAKTSTAVAISGKGVKAEHQPRVAAFEKMVSGRAKDAVKAKGGKMGKALAIAATAGAAAGAAAVAYKKSHTKKASQEVDNKYLQLILSKEQ